MSTSVTYDCRLTGWAVAVIASSVAATEVVKSFMLCFGLIHRTYRSRFPSLRVLVKKHSETLAA